MQSTFGSQRVAWPWEFCKVSWQSLEFYIDHAHLDSHDLFLRPGAAFCYRSASMRAFLVTWQMVQALISWFSTRKDPRVGSDQGYPRNEEKLLPSIWHGFQGRSPRNKKRGSILMLLYLPFPRHGKNHVFCQVMNRCVHHKKDEIKAAIVISTLDAWNPYKSWDIPWTIAINRVRLTVRRNSSISRTVTVTHWWYFCRLGPLWVWKPFLPQRLW